MWTTLSNSFKSPGEWPQPKINKMLPMVYGVHASQDGYGYN